MTPISNSDRIRLMKWFLIFSILYMGFAAVLSSWALPPNKDPLLTLVSTALRLLPKVQFVDLVCIRASVHVCSAVPCIRKGTTGGEAGDVGVVEDLCRSREANGRDDN